MLLETFIRRQKQTPCIFSAPYDCLVVKAYYFLQCLAEEAAEMNWSFAWSLSGILFGGRRSPAFEMLRKEVLRAHEMTKLSSRHSASPKKRCPPSVTPPPSRACSRSPPGLPREPRETVQSSPEGWRDSGKRSLPRQSGSGWQEHAEGNCGREHDRLPPDKCNNPLQVQVYETVWAAGGGSK